MDTSNVLKWASFTLFLVFHPQIERPLVATVPIPPFAPRPLCNFQLALANQACAYLPSSLVSPPPPPPPFAAVYPTPPPSSEHHDHIHSPSHRHRHKHHHHSHGHELDDGHGHNESHVDGHGHHRHDHHKHSHSHHKHRMSPIEQQCCKWLAQVDDECVCELLGRLPPFLARPIHEYTVRVAGSCNTTYSCGPGLLRL
ncbi:lateral signaling target protein 2 homolog [Cynara cardunculus var. scolymus]|uniref:lateral signaling target protein 2 homolog n=1 Tax=Cynara cardunculus var. scolymus TaxID=59895 RepID=UPI000D62F4A4|nr:lateral signaling target protein 2 homolog [Cynara cardunculus var. scolymus]